jgi:peroxiredoxin
MTRKFLFAVAVVALAVAAFAGNKKALETANARAENLTGKPAPEFSLQDLDQKPFHLADRRGQVVVLAFWATWCPPCRSEMPTFAKLQKEMASQGVAVTPLAFDDPVKAREFLSKKHLDVWSLVDEGGSVARSYGASFLPRTFVINREGIVVKAFINKVSEAELRSAIRAAQR